MADVREPEVFADLVPPVGRHPLGWTSGVLKISRGASLTIGQSELVFFNAKGRVVERLMAAFGYAQTTHVVGPVSSQLQDWRLPPQEAEALEWWVDGCVMASSAMNDPPAEWGRVRLIHWPLQIPVADDAHVLVQFMNTSSVDVETPAAVRTAILWVDGVPHPSTTGWNWNGLSVVRPRHAVTFRFSLGDFKDAPRAGEHDVWIDIFGQRTPIQRVRWYGEPFTANRL